MIRNRVVAALVVACSAFGLAGCTADADVVDNNIRNSADNFKIMRRVVFINTRDNSYLLEVVGLCNITDQTIQVETICKVPGGFVKHLMGLQGQDVTYVVEQVKAEDVSSDFYHFTVKPATLLPIPEFR